MTVTPGAANFLVIPFQTLWQIIVEYKPHIRFINAHTEGYRCHNDVDIIPNERFLVFPALHIIQPGMIGKGGIFAADEFVREAVYLVA